MLCFYVCLAGAALASAPAGGADAALTVTMDKEHAVIGTAARPLLRYRFGNAPFKPYVQELFSPSGANVLRDAPHDHLHHHALMYAIAVNGVNFWEEGNSPGMQQHVAFEKRPASGDRAGIAARLVWKNPRTGEALLLERRTIDVRQHAGSTLVTWTSELTPPEDKDAVTLTGAHYHGLGMRFAATMDAGGEMRNSENDLGSAYRGQERLGRAAWCTYTAKAGDTLVTVAAFGHPSNPSHPPEPHLPTLWFTMTAPFAYISATLNLHAQPLVLEKGTTLKLVYGVAVLDGRAENDVIETLRRDWAAMAGAEAAASGPADRGGPAP